MNLYTELRENIANTKEQPSQELVWNVIMPPMGTSDGFHVCNILSKWFIQELKDWLKLKKIDVNDFAAFADAVRSELAYRYWSRAEYELILTTWPTFMTVDQLEKLNIDYAKQLREYDERGWAHPHRVDAPLEIAEKIDVYDQIILNWDAFIHYLYDHRQVFA